MNKLVFEFNETKIIENKTKTALEFIFFRKTQKNSF